MGIKSDFVVLALLTLTGCASGIPDSNRSQVQLTKPQQTALEQGIKEGLKDGDSAKFGPFSASIDSSGHISVCGLVNAKNGFGGYIGYSPYLGGFTGDKFLLAGVGGTERSTDVIRSSCREFGLMV
jgi:hypothetical protein